MAHIELLNSALPKLRALWVFKCHGILLPLCLVINGLSESVSHLRSLRLRCVFFDSKHLLIIYLQLIRLSDCINMTIIPPPSKVQVNLDLEELKLHQDWETGLSFVAPFTDRTAASIKKIFISGNLSRLLRIENTQKETHNRDLLKPDRN